MSTRLILKTVELTPDGILIRSVEVMDAETGETVRAAKLTQQLADFLNIVEIDTDKFFEVQALREKNPAVTSLIQSFKLFT